MKAQSLPTEPALAASRATSASDTMGDGLHCLYDFGPMANDYDRWYGTPAGRAHDQRQKALVRSFLPSPRPGERLLDVGCGTGHWSRFFAEQGFAVVGVDISPEMIAAARSRNAPNCRFEVADACELPFEDASFGVAAAMATLEFVSDARAAVAEMFRCVKPGGSMLVGTLNRLAPLNHRRMAEGKQPYASARMFSPSELRRLLAVLGRVRMEVTVDAHAGGTTRGRRSMLRHVPAGAFIVAEVGK